MDVVAVWPWTASNANMMLQLLAVIAKHPSLPHHWQFQLELLFTYTKMFMTNSEMQWAL